MLALLKTLAAPALILALGSFASGPVARRDAVEASSAVDTQCQPATPWPVIAAGAPANSTYEAAGKPIPVRYREPVAGWVKMRFLSAADVNRRCAGGVPVCGRVFEACVRDGELIMPNPCDDPAGPSGQGYSGTLCHELAHINGWPETHGD